jgi:hypothetical protein
MPHPPWKAGSPATYFLNPNRAMKPILRLSLNCRTSMLSSDPRSHTDTHDAAAQAHTLQVQAVLNNGAPCPLPYPEGVHTRHAANRKCRRINASCVTHPTHAARNNSSPAQGDGQCCTAAHRCQEVGMCCCPHHVMPTLHAPSCVPCSSNCWHSTPHAQHCQTTHHHK